MERALRSTLWRGVGFALVLEAMLVPALLFWPGFRDNLPALKSMLGPVKFAGRFLDMLGQGGVTGYVVGQHFFKGCSTLGVAAAVLFAAGAVAGEAHRGTLELWLARPLSRDRILLERWLQGAVALVLPVFLTTWTIPPLLARVGESLAWWPLTLAAAHQSLLLLAIYAAAFLLSCVSRDPVKVAFTVLLLAILQFALYMVQTITHWSLFRLADVPRFLRIFQRNALEPGVALPLLAVTALLLVASLAAFRRRVP